MVYNVHSMKHLRVAEARARFGEILDEAERGSAVFIERRGVRFRVVAERPVRRHAASDPLFEFVDPVVAGGQWTWKAGANGLAFSSRRKRR